MTAVRSRRAFSAANEVVFSFACNNRGAQQRNPEVARKRAADSGADASERTGSYLEGRQLLPQTGDVGDGDGLGFNVEVEARQGLGVGLGALLHRATQASQRPCCLCLARGWCWGSFLLAHDPELIHGVLQLLHDCTQLSHALHHLIHGLLVAGGGDHLVG